MGNVQMVVKDKDGNVIRTLEDRAMFKELSTELAKAGDEVFFTLQDNAAEDRNRPVKIEILQYVKGTANSYKAAYDKDNFTACIVLFDAPSDYEKGKTKYEFAHYNRDLRKQVKHTSAVLLDKDNAIIKALALDAKVPSSKVCYLVPMGELTITPELFKNNCLVQVRRIIAQDNFSEWGTQIHTEWAISGKASLFGAELNLSHSSRDETIGLKGDNKVTVFYKDIVNDKSLGAQLPERINDADPATSLLGLNVSIEKLLYNKRSSCFNLKINIDTTKYKNNNESDLDFYKRNWGIAPDAVMTEDQIPADSKKIIDDLSSKGLKLFAGIYMKNIAFELEVTDENPN